MCDTDHHKPPEKIQRSRGAEDMRNRYELFQ
jgi:hypothetical protein